MTAGSSVRDWNTSTPCALGCGRRRMRSGGRTIVRGRCAGRDRGNPRPVHCGTAFSGQALVEFAIILPIFLLILCAMVDLGRFVYTQNALNDASRVAVRGLTVEAKPADCLTTDPLDTCATKIVLRRVAAVGGVPVVTTTCAAYGEPPKALSACAQGDTIKVSSVVDPWSALTPFLSGLMNVRIEGSARGEVR